MAVFSQMPQVDESSKLAHQRPYAMVCPGATWITAVASDISIGCRASAVWLSWVRAFAEAGIVGAIADWYAAAESGVEVCTAFRSLRSPAQVRTV